MEVLEKKPITMVVKGEYYLGQWKKGQATREGSGVMVKDGSLYEGFWKDNKEHGLGRFINTEGDVYQG